MKLQKSFVIFLVFLIIALFAIVLIPYFTVDTSPYGTALSMFGYFSSSDLLVLGTPIILGVLAILYFVFRVKEEPNFRELVVNRNLVIFSVITIFVSEGVQLSLSREISFLWLLSFLSMLSLFVVMVANLVNMPNVKKQNVDPKSVIPIVIILLALLIAFDGLMFYGNSQYGTWRY